MKKIYLQLFVIGQRALSKRAIKNLEELCALNELKDICKYDVIDLREHADIAEKERILATPLLIRTSPLPQIRIIGDLSNTQKILASLR